MLVYMHKKLLSSMRGFTLIELLVVVSIIGILMAMGMAAYTNAQKGTRDAKRRADMKAIQTAQEQYYAVNGEYARDCSASVLSEELPANPQDPKNTGVFVYSCASTGTGAAYDYCACAALENRNGNADAGCSFTSGSDGSAFCVKNLQ